MIEYVEIRNKTDRELLGVIDNAESIIWRSAYYGVGDFEIYAPFTPMNADLLKVGNYATRLDNKEIGIIEKVQATYSNSSGRMIIASGRFSKLLLGRRVIYSISGTSVSPTIISGNVETAIRTLVNANAIACPFDSGRNMKELKLGALAGIAKEIIDEAETEAEKQVTYKNLLEYTDGVLQEYELGAMCLLADDLKLAYTIYAGKDRSVDNTAGNEPIIFSQDFDNLVSSDYSFDDASYKNTALIGGEGEGTARFCVEVKNGTGSERREMFVEASTSSKTYKDSEGNDQTLSDAAYAQQLRTLGKQSLAGYPTVEAFSGEIDITNGSFLYSRDFELGDIVTIQDIGLGKYINPRITEVTEVQDINGYMVSAVFEA